jgi:HEPN domain-containing protein
MSKTADLSAWVAMAEEDYLLARSALRRKKPLRYGGCFHTQQCAEKYLKAVLVFREQAFPKTHDLLALSDLCAQAGVVIPIDPDELDRLSAYAVQVRYPGDEPTLEETHHAMEITRAVRRFVRRFLGLR